jgi:hypothetical protein
MMCKEAGADQHAHDQQPNVVDFPASVYRDQFSQVHSVLSFVELLPGFSSGLD